MKINYILRRGEHEKVETLFFENPKLDTEIYTFCKSNQEYNQAESAYEAMMGDLRAKLGF